MLRKRSVKYPVYWIVFGATAAVVLVVSLLGFYAVHNSHAAGADINGDGIVNILDLSILASHYGQTGQTFATGDLNGDGSVNILDLSILATNWDSGTQSPAFLSYPHQTSTQSFSGSNNLEISNRSYVGLSSTSAVLTISNATNVYLHDLDFDSNCGDIFLINVTGQVRIENIRARNTGGPSANCPIGSGHKNVIQLNNVFDNGTGGLRHIKIYGGQTEDAVSVFKSGGTDATHPLIIEDVHIEHPLPPDPLAWASGSGTCINLADAGGHDIILRNSTFLNCGAVGIQMNMPTRVMVTGNIVYGAQRVTSNVGLSQFGTCSCSGDVLTNNRVWWKNSSGSSNPQFIQNSSYFSNISGNVLQDTSIDPNSLKVVL